MNHDFLVRTLVLDVINHGGLNIRADLPGFQKPDRIIWIGTQEGHEPDVTATLFGTHFLFEVETDDSIFNEHTTSQLNLFGTFAQQQSHVCCLVVPALSYFRAMIAVSRIQAPIQIIHY